MSSATFATPTTFDDVTRDRSNPAETLTLLSTFPTLWRTLVAISAMPTARA